MATVDVGEVAQLSAQPGAVEDVVAEDEGGVVTGEEVLAEDEGLRQPLGPRLHHVLEAHAQVGAVAEQSLEGGLVLGGGDDQDLADPGGHEGAERVVDHRLVEHRQNLLADAAGDRPQPGSGAARQHNALHRHASVSADHSRSGIPIRSRPGRPAAILERGSAGRGAVPTCGEGVR